MGSDIEPLNDDTEFENDSVDPGFATENSEKEHPIDVDFVEKLKNIENKGQKSRNDAMNLNNDRENGAYNPKNI